MPSELHRTALGHWWLLLLTAVPVVVLIYVVVVEAIRSLCQSSYSRTSPETQMDSAQSHSWTTNTVVDVSYGVAPNSASSSSPLSERRGQGAAAAAATTTTTTMAMVTAAATTYERMQLWVRLSRLSMRMGVCLGADCLCDHRVFVCVLSLFYLLLLLLRQPPLGSLWIAAAAAQPDSTHSRQPGHGTRHKSTPLGSASVRRRSIRAQFVQAGTAATAPAAAAAAAAAARPFILVGCCWLQRAMRRLERKREITFFFFVLCLLRIRLHCESRCRCSPTPAPSPGRSCRQKGGAATTIGPSASANLRPQRRFRLRPLTVAMLWLVYATWRARVCRPDGGGGGDCDGRVCVSVVVLNAAFLYVYNVVRFSMQTWWRGQKRSAPAASWCLKGRVR